MYGVLSVCGLNDYAASEGYGANGFPAWGIPPGGTLYFTIEVLEIKA